MSGLPIRTNYLNNRELLAEIHRSKSSFSYFIDKRYAEYHAIVTSLDDITPNLIEETKIKYAMQKMQNEKSEQKAQGLKQHQIKITTIEPEDVEAEDIVWRLMTFEHIPLDPNRSKHPKTESEKYVKTNFLPFKHYIIRDGNFVEVGRSHWINGLHNGYFCQDQGRISNRLAMMFMKLVDRYSQRSNWRGYTYLSEMKGQALVQLSLVGLQFDESRSDNPFAYYTVVTSNAFTRILNLEKRNQDIRDDILIMNGAPPSITRQIEDELQQKAQNSQAEDGENVIVPLPTLIKRGPFGRITRI